MYNHNKAQQSKNRVHISWDILYMWNLRIVLQLDFQHAKHCSGQYSTKQSFAVSIYQHLIYILYSLSYHLLWRLWPRHRTTNSINLPIGLCPNITLIGHKKRFDTKMLDTKVHGSTQKCPVLHKIALPSMHQLPLTLSNTPLPPLRNCD